MVKLFLWQLLICTSFAAYSQDNPRPSRSRFYNSKFSTFNIRSGDTLLYSIKKDTERYELLVIVQDFGTDIKFNYTIKDTDVDGSITLKPTAINNAAVYDFPQIEKTREYSDTSAFWFSKKNFNELNMFKETTLNMGDGNEVFRRRGIQTLKIRYKGKEKILTIINIENANAKAKKTMSLLTDENNPLIIKLDADISMTLKEVR